MPKQMSRQVLKEMSRQMPRKMRGDPQIMTNLSLLNIMKFNKIEKNFAVVAHSFLDTCYLDRYQDKNKTTPSKRELTFGTF